jgi:hypothetical protein
MEEKIWFEVFTSTEEDGTETVDSFDSIEEAEQYVAEHCEQDLWIDKWKLGENGNEKVAL